MIKKFRAWDGEQYWYANEHLIFINDYKAVDLQTAPFELKDLDMFTGKLDSKGAMIYENDLIKNKFHDTEKTYQVIWSDEECGFRKVPYGFPFPETKIDEAFMEVIETIHSQDK